jgi:hypothetical protein
MMGSGFGEGLARSFAVMGCLLVLIGAGLGIFLWWAIPALCRFIAAHWH